MKTVLIIFLALFCVGSIQAQSKTPEEWAVQRTDSLQQVLTLTTEQYPQVYSIELAFAQKADPIRKSSDGKVQKLKALKELDEKRDTELKTVLTEEQFSAYSEKKKAQRKQFKEQYKANRKT